MSTKATAESGLTDKHIQEYFAQGYTIVDGFFDDEELDLMRGTQAYRA